MYTAGGINARPGVRGEGGRRGGGRAHPPEKRGAATAHLGKWIFAI